ncbi:hypothetical protein KO317_03705 [Candidatus Micrarchaeota archaeon]|nr:hypothetical protein [Candidatus Micrarchaeota archaeon]
MRNNFIDATCIKVVTSYYPIPVVDRIKQIFLRAKLTSAKLAGSNSEMTKCSLSTHLFEMAKYSAECKKFKRAIELTRRSLKLLTINSNCSHTEYVERTIFLLNCNVDLASYSVFYKKPKVASYVLEDALEIFNIVIKDAELTTKQHKEIEPIFNRVLQGFLNIVHYYHIKSQEASNKNRLISEMKYLHLRYISKQRLIYLLDLSKEIKNVDPKLIDSSNKLLQKIIKSC